jgi:hypothetical protein
MPRVVPSQVVAFIDQALPGRENETKPAKEVLSQALSRGHRQPRLATQGEGPCEAAPEPFEAD